MSVKNYPLFVEQTTLEQTRSREHSTPLISIGTSTFVPLKMGKRTESNFSKSEVRNVLEPSLPLIGAVAQLQTDYR